MAVSGVAYGWGWGERLGKALRLGLGLTEHQPTPLQYPAELKCAV